MKIRSLKIVYFSPTGTTKRVLLGIAQGIYHENQEIIDLTSPDKRSNSIKTGKSDLLIIGVPVYMGRVPSILQPWLESLKAYKTPVVLVVVYGNRVYDDALLELKDTMINSGCIPIAGAAFIGEHSFSSPDIPIAIGRPDKDDISLAEKFGKRIKKKIESVECIEDISNLNLPGKYPYGGFTRLWSVDFIQVNNNCKGCGICFHVCPVNAIDYEDYELIDIEKCITCCACIKNCPEKARVMKESEVKKAARSLNNNCRKRKDPVFFI